MPEQHDDDALDGCDLDFGAEADDPVTAALRPLFPDGDPAKADEWHALFGHLHEGDA
jgi:hypothetical protein